MTQQCFGEKWYLAKTGRTPVIPLALIVHISDVFPVLLIIIISWDEI